ncbi:hypothetical protein KVT40_008309 [Elsinoe batatas]|uniref:Uncharacterized protein n=1 Tax=Elsinoe batatas TaxID=2601811 RepID=A0A8K0L009_9PEZI|nr:hypothetical protein KVT40_008309 [Elsinoe batatas]
MKCLTEECGDNVWGLTIYRCTYSDDSAWTRFMAIINERTRYSLDRQSLPELFTTLDWNVQDDRRLLDGATVDFVRERFKLWKAEALKGVDERLIKCALPRHNHCIHVDEAALRSVVDAPEPPPPKFHIPGLDTKRPPMNLDGYVNLVAEVWDEDEGRDSGVDEPEVDGEDYADVGYCRVQADYLAPTVYVQLMEQQGYRWLYNRPPGMAYI